MDEFKDRLLELIKSKNISASELSKKINVQRSNISHILSGRNKPSLDFVLKLCDSNKHLGLQNQNKTLFLSFFFSFITFFIIKR